MHHATLYIGNFSEVFPLLQTDEQIPGADVRHIIVEQFGITDARSLSEESARMPVERPVRTFVVAFSRATIEAQNALLKTLEEPAPTTRFYIIVPHEDVLIPTVRSRLLHVDYIRKMRTKDDEVVGTFVAMTYGERLAMIAERIKAEDTVWMDTLLRGLEQRAAKTHAQALLRDLVMLRKYWDTRGASKKMLLEHLAVTIPNA